MKKFEYLDHMADIKIRVNGAALNEIFENSVLAFCNYVSGGEKISSTKGKIINVSGNDIESLLYNFMDELIYLLDAEHFLACKAKITLMGNNLKAELYGDNASNYNNLNQIKAATYHEMHVKKVKSRDNKNKEEHWEAQFILDV